MPKKKSKNQQRLQFSYGPKIACLQNQYLLTNVSADIGDIDCD